MIYKISVDCEENDPVDIKAGGPQMLGYDFFVEVNKEEEVQDYIDFIKEKLNKHSQPLERISFYKSSSKMIWTKAMISKSIEYGY
jgi:hypothetical protein